MYICKIHPLQWIPWISINAYSCVTTNTIYRRAPTNTKFSLCLFGGSPALPPSQLLATTDLRPILIGLPFPKWHTNRTTQDIAFKTKNPFYFGILFNWPQRVSGEFPSTLHPAPAHIGIFYKHSTAVKAKNPALVHYY